MSNAYVELPPIRNLNTYVQKKDRQINICQSKFVSRETSNLVPKTLVGQYSIPESHRMDNHA